MTASSRCGTGRGRGVDRSLDAIRHANADGTDPRGGVLVMMGDDHGAVSSTLPHQTEHDMIAVQVPVLAPAGVQDYLRFGLLGWEMSRASGAWVGFKCQTEVVESSATVSLEGLQTPAVLPEGSGTHALRWPDGPFPKEARIEKKLALVQEFARLNGLDECFGDDRANSASSRLARVGWIFAPRWPVWAWPRATWLPTASAC